MKFAKAYLGLRLVIFVFSYGVKEMMSSVNMYFLKRSLGFILLGGYPTFFRVASLRS